MYLYHTLSALIINHSETLLDSITRRNLRWILVIFSDNVEKLTSMTYLCVCWCNALHFLLLPSYFSVSCCHYIAVKNWKIDNNICTFLPKRKKKRYAFSLHFKKAILQKVCVDIQIQIHLSRSIYLEIRCGSWANSHVGLGILGISSVRVGYFEYFG